ncbi:hypothetical protein M8845_18620 [Gelidibacter japonicus]|jgi:hypothetical protein|uniref:hypothetical protein n=1 Tax=Gelidibacter TaxID=49279 RepID=UPI001FF507BD|nr:MULTISPECIES: hypothetical protein [Gelidibacter]MCK0114663.1 hypothetical protein [Gelidibacter sp. F63206]MCL8009441.1 hypothetical protein [Gelidibacter japonicus]
MNEKKTKYSQRHVLSSSNIDKHGHVITKEALESSLKFINGKRKPRLGLDHNRNFPPMGRINNGEVIEKDGAHYLVADKEYFDISKTATLENGLELIEMSFSDENYAFIESEFEFIDTIEIQIDPINLGSFENGQKFLSDLKSESEIEIKGSEFIRKSEIPDPEIVLKLTEIIAIALGIGLRKIPEKLAEAIGEDLVKFYKLIGKAIRKSAKEMIPKNRPIHFVVEIPINKSTVELIVTTRNPDIAINAYKKEVIENLRNEIKTYIKHLKAEKIQFIFNEENKWEMNYILASNGKVIGTKKSFRKRDEYFQLMVEKQKRRDNKNNA